MGLLGKLQNKASCWSAISCNKMYVRFPTVTWKQVVAEVGLDDVIWFVSLPQQQTSMKALALFSVRVEAHDCYGKGLLFGLFSGSYDRNGKCKCCFRLNRFLVIFWYVAFQSSKWGCSLRLSWQTVMEKDLFAFWKLWQKFKWFTCICLL